MIIFQETHGEIHGETVDRSLLIIPGNRNDSAQIWKSLKAWWPNLLLSKCSAGKWMFIPFIVLMVAIFTDPWHTPSCERERPLQQRCSKRSRRVLEGKILSKPGRCANDLLEVYEVFFG